MQAVTNWRNLSSEEKNIWKIYASTYPVPCQFKKSGFLTGYQLFIKRQYYIFLNENIQSDWLLPPLTPPFQTFAFSATIEQIDNCLDVTEPYIKAFGLIPAIGSFLLLKIIPMSVTTGQFFAPIVNTVEVIATYIDGIFISLSLPSEIPNVVFSLYLSKPVRESNQFTGTKVKYMGCFTTKTFIQLTDTPSTYAGQGGKKIVVNAAENGIEFVPEASSGLTCDTLPSCPTIISINDQILNIIKAIISGGSSSVPPIKWGLLYNHYCITAPSPMCAAGWHFPTKAEIEAICASLGGNSVAGHALREQGSTYWTAPNTGATNLSKFNGRGAGWRTHQSGATFNNLFVTQYLWTTTVYPNNPTIYSYWATFSYSSGSVIFDIQGNKAGASLRLIKDDSNNTGYYTGNDGKIYRTVKIGNIVITADSLAETKFRDGSTIPIISDSNAWYALTSPGACAFNNDMTNVLL
jgi:uncharacterized protein (TIGR02145 family)